MLHIGQNVEKLLVYKRMRKKELIELLGITRQGFDNKLKTGNFKPNELEIIAKYFDMEVFDLLSGEVAQVSEGIRVESTDESKMQQLIDKIFDELKMLRQQLQKKDEHIDKLLDMMGKLDPISEPAKVMSITANEYKPVA